MAGDIFDSFRGKPEKQGYNSMQTPWQSGYLSDMMGQAQGVYNQGPLTAAANSPLAAQSRGVLGDTLSGKYMDPNTNPYLSAAVNDALGLAGSDSDAACSRLPECRRPFSGARGNSPAGDQHTLGVGRVAWANWTTASCR